MDDEKSKFERVKQHLKDNKKEYLIGAGCLVIGTTIGSAIVYRQLGGVPLEIRQTAKNQALVVWKPEITQVALVKKCCPDPIPVLDKETGIPYPSMRTAASLTNEIYTKIRNDANGPQLRWEKLPETVFA